MSVKRGCIFDFDDTLVETTIYYDKAKERFAEKMSGFGFPVEEALDILNQFDIKNVLKCGGFHKECFPKALVETYEYFCAKHGVGVCRVTSQWLEDIGWWVFEQPAELINGVTEALELLKGKIPLYMATKGDAGIQKARISESGLEKYFEGIYIVPDKTHSEYLTIAVENGLNPAVSWIVGNSMKGDINPGIKSGFNCIHVFHKNTWDFEEEAPVGDHYSVRSISQVPSIILGHNPNAQNHHKTP